MDTCAVHGLKYDPTQHSSCVMCRRGTVDEAFDPVERERSKAFKLAGIGALAIALFAGIGVALNISSAPDPKLPPPPAPKVAVAVAPAPKPVPPPPSLVPVASASGAKPTMVPRMQLERAKESCAEHGPHAGGGLGCLLAITPLLEQLTPMPVSGAPNASAVHAYEMNRTGLGFDCLWFSVPQLTGWTEPKGKRAPKEYPYVGLLVASPKEHPALVSLDAKSKPQLAEVESAPWPSDYAAFVSYDGRASTRGPKAIATQYSACMTFPDDKPVTVYAGVATWISTGPSSKDDGAAFRAASIEALGLKGSLALK